MLSHIEYTLLDPLVLDSQIDTAGRIASHLRIGALCVPPYWVKKASREVAGTDIDLLTVVGFPLGYQRTEAKIAEMELAFADGATAIEVVMNMSAFKSKRMNWIKAEIARFANLVHAREAMLTIVTDIDMLDETELEIFCKTCTDAGADYVKTSIGYPLKEASSEQIELAIKLLPASVGIKAYTHANTLQAVESLLNRRVEKVCLSSVDFLQQQ